LSAQRATDRQEADLVSCQLKEKRTTDQPVLLDADLVSPPLPPPQAFFLGGGKVLFGKPKLVGQLRPGNLAWPTNRTRC